VAIARALAQQPEVIVADEPVASLDPQVSTGILDLLRDICHAEGVAVISSLHQVHFARSHADRIVGLAGGRVVADTLARDFDDVAAARLYGAAGTA
jgi:phosphonate transport system ATP-binding protein